MSRFIPDLYKILDIPPESNEEEIKNAFKLKSRNVHSDKTGNSWRKDLMSWQSTLLDSVKRKRYDEKLTKFKMSQSKDSHRIIDLNLGGNGSFSDNVATDVDSGVDDSSKITPTGNQSFNRRSGGGKERVVHNISSDSDSDQDAPKIVEPSPTVEGRSNSSTDKSGAGEIPMEVENEPPKENAEEQSKWKIKLSSIILR